MPEAREAVAKLEALHPDYRAIARQDLELFLYPSPEVVDRLLEGLEKAGLFD